MRDGKNAAWVVVVGEFGRSPRMQYHAISLLQTTRYDVIVFAIFNNLEGIRPELTCEEFQGRVTFRTLPSLPKLVERLPTLPRWFLKLVVQFWQLLVTFLACHQAPAFILVQSPPAMPVVLVCLLIAFARRSRVILDIHNLAYSLMRQAPLNRSKSSVNSTDSLVIRIAAWYERTVIRKCHASITVTQAFSKWLETEWGVKSAVLHDKAPEWFHPVTPATAHELMCTLKPELLQPLHGGADFLRDEWGSLHTPLTQNHAGDGIRKPAVRWRRATRPFLLVSSTSWTPDEDFSILLEAAMLYDAAAWLDPGLAPLIIIVTGKGPNKEAYLTTLRQKTLTHVAIRCGWLSSTDYPTILACADLGISLHTSSSDLDLPMKVSDMLGSGTPVCAVRYPCAEEQVKDGKQGFLFTSASELSLIWQRLFGQQPNVDSERGHSVELQGLVHAVAEGSNWAENWASVMPRLLSEQTGLPPANFLMPNTIRLSD